MGIYAQTGFTIICKNKKSAKEVYQKLSESIIDENGNTFGTKLELCNTEVFGYESSNRIQNLTFRCEGIWELIKDIKSVIELNCPFLSETDGEYFTNEDNYNK